MNQKEINRQITKFGFYGFFKNLRFFDPVLLIYLFQNGMSAFHIGLLYSVREIIIYIFEIPSGVFADRYGKKTELIICFLFYIGSFVIFAIGSSFFVFLLAMILFGLGEAFRSGTHKSMIMLFLDQNEMSDEKSKTYGKTRSLSMIGSMFSSIFTIYLVINVPELKFLFFFAIIPYLMDIILILTYPNSLNDRKESTFSWKQFARENKESLAYVLKDKKMRRILLRSSSYQAGFKILKDFIQLILVSVPITILLFDSFTAAEHVEIYSAIMYVVIFFISAITSRYAYKLLVLAHADIITELMWLLSGVTTIVIGIFVNQIIIVFIGFIFIYIYYNLRKPIMVEVIGDYADPERRASVLSVDSQMTSIFVIVFAPILGYISDTLSYGTMFILVGAVMSIIYISSKLQKA